MMQREKTEKVRRRKGRIAAALAAALLVTSMTAQFSYADDLDDFNAAMENASVTIQAPAEKEDGTFKELPDANVELDLYQVAKGLKEENSIAYYFEWNSSYSDAAAAWEAALPDDPTGSVAADDVEALAQGVAAVALADETSAVSLKYDTGKVNVMDDPVKVEPGMYLVIAHSKDAALSEYKDDKTGGKLSTIAKASSKQYRFAPMLVSVPQRDMDEIGTATIEGKVTLTYPIYSSNTSADSGKWTGPVTIDAKVAEEELFGSLRINKALVNHETVDGRIDPATFVFSIEATLDGEPVFTDVVSMTFTATGSDSRVLHRIPVGASVTVDEVYHGSVDYKLISKVPEEPVIIIPDNPDDPNEMVEVSFENEYEPDKWNGGGSADNHFGTVETDGKWDWDDSSTTKTLADNSGVETYSLFNSEASK